MEELISVLLAPLLYIHCTDAPAELSVTETLKCETNTFPFSTLTPLPTIVPLLQSPNSPGNSLCNKTISLLVLGQSKSLPVQSVLPPPTTVQL